ncbi:MAG: response regulator [Deltaproteobacteria bacterium]|nr:response regulator [Deltaproteobacteria bacterium]
MSTVLAVYLTLGVTFAVLVGVERKRYLSLWALAFLALVCWETYLDLWRLGILESLESMVGDVLKGISGLLLVIGVYQLLGARPPRYWPVVAAVTPALEFGLAGLWRAHPLFPPPLTLFLVLALGYTAYRIWRVPEGGWGRIFASLFLAFEGIYNALLPYLVLQPWFSRWNAFLDVALILGVSLGVIVMHFERVRAEADVRLADYQRLFEGAREGLFRGDLQGRLLSANAALMQLLKLEELEPPHTLDPGLVPPGFVERILVEGEVEGVPLRLERADGTIAEVEITASLVRAEDGSPQRIDGRVVEVTERHRIRARIESGQRMEALGRLAGGVAHGYNNLLTAILAGVEQASEFLPAGTEGHQGLLQVRESVEQGARLTRQLLSFARRDVVHGERLDLGEVLEQTQLLLGQLLTERIRLSLELAAGELPVRCALSQLDRLIMNLALNARDAMPGGGEFTLRCHEGDNLAGVPGVVLEFEDNGEGMTEEVKERAFEPFFTTKDEASGSGLGLSAVYGIVKQLSGEILLESSEGVGTLVRIWLPKAELTRQERARAIADRKAELGRVLVVEDMPVIRTFIERVLTRAGAEVRVAASGPEALEAAAGTRFDLLITDVVMPEMTGPELVEQLRARELQPPVLFISGHASDEKALEGDERAAFLAKPFASAQLLEAVYRLVDRGA